MATDVMNASWLLLLHQIPAKPDYLRVKIWRRMQRLGAVPLKNAAWVLPAGESAREDFEWLIREIAGDGGEAILCDARFLAGLNEAQIASLGRAGRLAPPTQPSGNAQTAARGVAEAGRVWVTRRNVFVDRMASAWLIRRHVDPHAQFKFVEDDYAPAANEVRFDMYGGEFTHVGDACTFEVLASAYAPENRAVAFLGEVVHDLDLKDARYGHPESAGLELALQGICALTGDDAERVEHGCRLFDWIHEAAARRVADFSARP